MGNNINNINNINDINDNSIYNNEIKLDVVIETLLRIFLFEKRIKELCNNEDNKNNDSSCIITSKNLISKYKEIFQFDHLKKYINNNEIILKHINKMLSTEDIRKEDTKEESYSSFIVSYDSFPPFFHKFLIPL